MKEQNPLPVCLLWGCDGQVAGYSFGRDHGSGEVMRGPGESDSALFDRAKDAAMKSNRPAFIMMAIPA